MSDIISLANQWIEARRLAPNTRRLYDLEINRFAEWMGLRERGVREVGARDVQEYLIALGVDPGGSSEPFHRRRKKALNPRSREQARRILHAFFEWAARERHIEHSPFWNGSDPEVVLRPQPSPPIEVPPLSGPMRRLLCQMPEKPYRLEELRAVVVAHLAFWLGASRNEIATLTTDDFIEQKTGATLRLPLPDGGHVEKQVPPQTRRVIRCYLETRSKHNPSDDAPAPLIGSLKTGRRIGPAAIRQVLAHWVKTDQEADIPMGPVCPRQLRQSFESIAHKIAIQERVVAKHFRTKKLLSAIDGGPVPYHPNQLYAEVGREIR